MMFSFYDNLAIYADANGTVSFRYAFHVANECCMTEEFLEEYGEQDWIDPEDGRTIGVDVGELVAWIAQQSCTA